MNPRLHASTKLSGVIALLLILLAGRGAHAQANTEVWGVNQGGEIWRWAGGTWTDISGGFTQVSIGNDGAVWAVNSRSEIYRRKDNQWERMPGALIRISVGTNSNVWGVNTSGGIWHWDGAKWIVVAGSLSEISVGSDGAVWGFNGGGWMYRRKGNDWEQMPGGPVRISVGSDKNVWGVNGANEILHWDGAKWGKVDGSLTNIAAAADGTVWGVDRNAVIFRREGEKWTKVDGRLAQLSVRSTNAGGTSIALAPISKITPPSTTIQAPPISNITPPQTLIAVSGGPAIAVQPTASPTTPAVDPRLEVRSSLDGAAYAPHAVAGLKGRGLGPVGVSFASCGVQDKGLCKNQPAALLHNANSAVTCPKGSFVDLGKLSCWSCPEGYTRSTAAVDSDRACQKADAGVKGGFLEATYQAPLCAAGTFYDPIYGGECYSCKGGYNRSAYHIETNKACIRPAYEDFAPVNRQKAASVAWDCKAPAFFDGGAPAGCYTCPAGYSRTALARSSAHACSKLIPEDDENATHVKHAQCGTGEFKDALIPGKQDPARGGGCWTCPSATTRTVFSVASTQACERAAGIQYAAATQTQHLTCEEGEFFDPINSNASQVKARLSERNAAPKPAGDWVRLEPAGSGGTCWACPSGTHRSIKAVYDSEACVPEGILWESADYNQPGLFGLEHAEAVALNIILKRRALIDQAISGLLEGPAGAGLGQGPDVASREWQTIATHPQDSIPLQIAVFSRVVAAVNDPGHATEEEIKLRDEVIEQIKEFRVFMAQDALNAYDAWHDNRDYRQGVYKRSVVQTAVDIDDVPPDFEAFTAEYIMGNIAGGTGAAVATGLTMTSEKVHKALFPHAKRTVWLSEEAAKQAELKAGAKLASKAGRKLSQSAAAKLAAKVTAKLGEKAAEMMAKAGLSTTLLIFSAGPQIIVEIGMEILTEAIDQEISKLTAKAKLQAGVDTARNEPVDFARLMSTEDGTKEAFGDWATLMGGPVTAIGIDGKKLPPDADGNKQKPPLFAPEHLDQFAQAVKVSSTPVRPAAMKKQPLANR